MTDIRPDPVAQALREGVAHIAAQTTTPPWPLVAKRHTRRNRQRLRRISLATGAVLATAAIAVAVLLPAGDHRPEPGAHPVRFGNHTLMVRDPLADKVHLKSLGFAGVGMLGVANGLWRRLGRRGAVSPEHQGA